MGSPSSGLMPGPLTMDSEVEVAAVKFVLGGHLAAVASGKVGLGICDVQLEQVDLWGRGVWGDGAGRRGPSPLQETGGGQWPPACSPSQAQLARAVRRY